MIKFAQSVLTVVLVIASIVASGYTIQAYWGWFMVPLGVIAISFWHAVGLSLMFGLFSLRLVQVNIANTTTWNDRITTQMVKLAAIIIFYGLGNLANSFM